MIGTVSPAPRPSPVLLSLAATAGLLFAGTVPHARSAPRDADGHWAGTAKQTLKIQNHGRRRVEGRGSLTLGDGRWYGRPGPSTVARRLGGAATPKRRKHRLELDDAARASLAADIETWIQTSFAADGLTVDAAVTLLRVNAGCRAKNPRRRGPRVVLRERHRFEVVLTGDVDETRRGTLRTKSKLVPDDAVPPRAASALEVPAPYVDDPGFWQRDDLYVMTPDVEPLDLWPDEVLFPTDHGVRIVVLLPGDYRGRSNGSLGDGILYVASSGTETEPLLYTYAPAVGADLSETPHAATRVGGSEARLVGFRVWNQHHQVFRGLTFRDSVTSCLIRNATGIVVDGCVWHETGAQPLRIRFDSHRNTVQRCVFRRFDRESWGHNDTVAIQLSDDALTHNRIVSNVMLNYTDSYQHTDRDGDPYGLGAGTIVDNNFMGFTEHAYVESPDGELMCGENTIDMKMGGTEDEPVRISNNVFFGVRAAQANCAASGSGGYAVTLHRRGTWIELTDNLFVDCDSGVFLNAFFRETEPAQGRIDPHVTLRGNTFSGIRSFATAFPARTGRVVSGPSAAVFAGNTLVQCERLMEQEPFPGTGTFDATDNRVFGDLELAPRDEATLAADGNTFHPAESTVIETLRVPWHDIELRYAVPR